MPGLTPRSTDIFVAVMGMTGTGKSTFISLCTGQDVPIGHNLQASILWNFKGTQVVDVYKLAWSNMIDVYLIDTPGFDDTNRSDTEVLREIAAWFTKSYQDDIKLSGILYLHRINDPRMAGSAKKNLFMLRKLCGSSALSGVILVSTMWEALRDDEDGLRRERELVDTQDFWGVLVGSGATVERHDNTLESARALLKRIVRAETTMVMDIQKEMVTDGKTLDETQAGEQVGAELDKARERFGRDLAEIRETISGAMRARDEESAEMLRQHQEETTRKLNRIVLEREQLKVSIEKMHMDMAEFERRYKEQAALMQSQKDEGDKTPRESVESLEELENMHLHQHNRDTQSSSPSGLTVATEASAEAGPDDRWLSPGLHQLDNYMSLTLERSELYFLGPLYDEKTSDSAWIGSLGKNEQQRCVAFGVKGVWYRHYHIKGKCRTTQSHSLKTYYPLLYEWLKEDVSHLGCPEHVSLGPDGQFFIRLKDGSQHYTPSSELTNMEHAAGPFKRVWYGYDDTYVAEHTNGTCTWLLKSHYKALDSFLKTQRSIRDLALNISSPQSFVILTKNGSSLYETGSVLSVSFNGASWERFTRKNYNLEWSGDKKGIFSYGRYTNQVNTSKHH